MRIKPIPMIRLTEAQTATYWAGVDMQGGPNACWPWTRANDGNGYGRMKVSGIAYRAHRLSYWLSHGVDPGNKQVCHKCDNPPCCNPAHHFLGTMSENLKDCVAKGRMPMREMRGESNGNAKLTAEQVEQIKGHIRDGKNNVHIGRMFGVTHQMISRIRRGKAWGISEPLQPRYASLRGSR